MLLCRIHALRSQFDAVCYVLDVIPGMFANDGLTQKFPDFFLIDHFQNLAGSGGSNNSTKNVKIRSDHRKKIKMKTVILVMTWLTVSSAIEFTDDWRSYKRQHGKQYRSVADEEYRFQVYTNNKKRIDDHNAMFNLGLVSYRMRLNRFGDMIQPEVTAVMTGFNKTGQLVGHKLSGFSFLYPANVQLPTAVDWRQQRAVTRVKDQGRCASSWAFSAIGALEGQIARNTGNLVQLSEQNLMDCSSTYGNEGCNGGLTDNAFEYMAKHGVITEDDYPYEAEPHFCRYRSNLPLVRTKGHVDLPMGNEEALKAAVATVGPVAAVINAGNPGFTFYSGGIFTGEPCIPHRLDHAVLVVGYGNEKGQDFWIIKNSWNSNWGEDGYMRLARNRRNVCNIATMASYPAL